MAHMTARVPQRQLPSSTTSITGVVVPAMSRKMPMKSSLAHSCTPSGGEVDGGIQRPAPKAQPQTHGNDGTAHQLECARPPPPHQPQPRRDAQQHPQAVRPCVDRLSEVKELHYASHRGQRTSLKRTM